MKHLLTLLASILFLAGAGLTQPAITILTTPAYGTMGQITGQVTGITPAGHRVAVYILVEGLGWWSKPTAASPSVPVSASGTFTAAIATGGLDRYATIIHAALLAPGVSAPVALSAPRIPSNLQTLATVTRERPGRTISFAGHDWAVKDGPLPVDPGSNRFSSRTNDVWVDAAGRLHLTLKQHGSYWWSTEVMLLDSLGYGTYSFTTESQVGSLDPRVTFGAFVWDNYGDGQTPGSPHREIDFEDSRWNNANDPTSSQWVVQPYQVNGNLGRYTVPRLPPPPILTRYFRWSPSAIEFVAVDGAETPCSAAGQPAYIRATYLHDPSRQHYVPTPGRERFRFNLWLNSGSAPLNNAPVEVIITDFRFSPFDGIYPLGCGSNPSGSFSVLSGGPVLGSTMILGAHNPLATQNHGALVAFLATPIMASRFPCGIAYPGWGMAGGAGELVLDLGSLITHFSGTPWTGAPVPWSISFPNNPAFAGVTLGFQGILLDPSPSATQQIALTAGLQVCLR
ncbi:MAG: hypothetical protein NXI31_26320 [bacterium]|nr:hypothetical protein [bacterium]